MSGPIAGGTHAYVNALGLLVMTHRVASGLALVLNFSADWALITARKGESDAVA